MNQSISLHEADQVPRKLCNAKLVGIDNLTFEVLKPTNLAY